LRSSTPPALLLPACTKDGDASFDVDRFACPLPVAGCRASHALPRQNLECKPAAGAAVVSSQVASCQGCPSTGSSGGRGARRRGRERRGAEASTRGRASPAAGPRRPAEGRARGRNQPDRHQGKLPLRFGHREALLLRYQDDCRASMRRVPLLYTAADMGSSMAAEYLTSSLRMRTTPSTPSA